MMPFMFGPWPRPGCDGDEVRVRELDLVLAGEDADLLVDVVGAVADLADLVGDPELEALRSGRAIMHRDGLLLAAVLEGDAHEAAADHRLIFAGLAALAERRLLEARVLGGLASARRSSAR